MARDGAETRGVAGEVRTGGLRGLARARDFSTWLTLAGEARRRGAQLAHELHGLPDFVGWFRERLPVGVPGVRGEGGKAVAGYTPAPLIDGRKPHPLVRPYRPRVLILQLNKRCNLFCGFCDHYKFELEMTAEEAFRIVDQMVEVGITSLVITGGEPFLHRRIFEIIDYAKRRHIGLNITTNGTSLKAHAAKIAASGLDSLSISIDGPGELHDRIRGREGTRAKIEEGLTALRATGKMPQINIYTVVTRENVFHLDGLYDEAVAQGFHYNCWPVNNAEGMYLKTAEEVAAYLAFCRRVTSGDAEFAGRMDYYERGMRYHAGEVRKVRCLGVSDQMGIAVDGTVIPCCVWGEEEKLKIGDIHTQTLGEILKSPATAAAMKGLFHEGCTVQCYNHSLYEFENATGLSSTVSVGDAPRAEAA